MGTVEDGARHVASRPGWGSGQQGKCRMAHAQPERLVWSHLAGRANISRAPFVSHSPGLKN